MSTPDSLAAWLAAWPQLREDLARQVEAADKAGRIDPDSGRSVLKAADQALLGVAGLADLTGSPETGDYEGTATFTLVKGRKPTVKGKSGQ